MGDGRETLEQGLPRPGDTVNGRYRILRQIGAGGMGVVFEAQHVEVGRVVALKFLQPNIAGDMDLVERFMREARAAASISHASIIKVFDVGWTDDGGIPYFAMELLEGRNLTGELLRSGPLTVSRAAELARQVLDALEAAHARGIVHRDLKPENIFLVPHGLEVEVKVLDFGISKVIGDTSITRTGAILGTPSYMSPEQARGKRVDHRTDIYATGAILYEMMIGRPPYEGRNYNEIIIQIATESPPPMAELRPGLHPSIIAVVERALSREPEDRWQSAREMAAALSHAVNGIEPFTELTGDTLDGATEITTSVKPTPTAWEITSDSTDDSEDEATHQFEGLAPDEDGATILYPELPAGRIDGASDPAAVPAGQARKSSLGRLEQRDADHQTDSDRARARASARLKEDARQSSGPGRLIAAAVALVLGAGITLAFATWPADDARPVQPSPLSLPPLPPDIAIDRGPIARSAQRAPQAAPPVTRPPEPRAQPACRVRATIAPTIAKVALDDDAVGTEIDLPFECGSRHRLTVSAAGFVPRELELRAKEQSSPLRVRLQRLGRPRGRPAEEPPEELERNPF